MCFANSVLQVLIYCQPFHKLFVDLGKTLGEGGGAEILSAESTGEGEKATPLVDATIKFLKEFQVAKAVETETSRRGGKGKEKEVNDDDWDGESFIPTYVYDALKEKKRFDHMRASLVSVWHCSSSSQFIYRVANKRTPKNSSDFILKHWRKSYR